ncbi:MAG: hypothetical protein QW478_01410 [Candidatus Micrarchaeaceae archaeon]
MEIKNLLINDKSCSFDLVTDDYRMANKLRRTIMSEIPTYAISKIIFEINNTCFDDNFIYNRLLFVPIKFKEHENKILTLDVEADKYEKRVYSKELKGDYEVVYDDIILLKLFPKQKLKLNVELEKGIGKLHSKWECINHIIFYPTDDVFHFEIEAIGNLPIEDIINEALTKFS